MSRARAPLRWVGGKQRLAPVLAEYLRPLWHPDIQYFEPFVGGGSVFFQFRPGRGTLADVNAQLIHFYEALRDQPLELRDAAAELDAEASKDKYDEARREFNAGVVGLREAALFLYLNRTGFNGVWRVNRSGTYTVPYGYRPLSLLPLDEWLEWSDAVGKMDLVCADYSKSLRGAESDAVVYLDPPYLDTSGREMFSRYTLRGFTREDHVALRDEVVRLTAIGTRVLLTVRDDPFICDLYRDFLVDVAPVSTTVGARGSHTYTSDLIVRNFRRA